MRCAEPPRESFYRSASGAPRQHDESEPPHRSGGSNSSPGSDGEPVGAEQVGESLPLLGLELRKGAFEGLGDGLLDRFLALGAQQCRLSDALGIERLLEEDVGEGADRLAAIDPGLGTLSLEIVEDGGQILLGLGDELVEGLGDVLVVAL